MKNSKSILAILLLVVLFTSCKKESLSPKISTGDVVYEVFSSFTDTSYYYEPKHIKFGYDNKVKDTIVIGYFKITLKVPASATSSDFRKIVFSCETENPCMFGAKISQVVRKGNIPHFNFSVSSAGTCPVIKRDISDKFIIDVE